MNKKTVTIIVCFVLGTAVGFLTVLASHYYGDKWAADAFCLMILGIFTVVSSVNITKLDKRVKELEDKIDELTKKN